MKLYYVVNARMPSEKAHGIQIAKMCEALIEAGTDLTLVVPGRGMKGASIQKFYNLRVDVPTIHFSVPDFYKKGKFGFALSSLFFVGAYAGFLLGKKMKGEDYRLYTVDMDSLAHTFLPLFGKTTVEMHSPKKNYILSRYFFAHATTVVATNTLIGEALSTTFHLPKYKVVIEPNGVDLAQFSSLLPKADAREVTGLPKDEKIALYVGRLLTWKGMEILPKATAHLVDTEMCYVVGGTDTELQSLTNNQPHPHLLAAGEKPFSEIPHWLVAADVGIVLGTGENQWSYRFTSPMKIFEYMAARLPIVASGTPALKDILAEDEAFFYEPDDIDSLAHTIHAALSDTDDAMSRANRAYEKVLEHTWDKRARRILTRVG